jgi:hypothetical protein
MAKPFSRGVVSSSSPPDQLREEVVARSGHARAGRVRRRGHRVEVAQPNPSIRALREVLGAPSKAADGVRLLVRAVEGEDGDVLLRAAPRQRHRHAVASLGFLRASPPRSRHQPGTWWKAGGEVTIVGGAAACVAFYTAKLVDFLVSKSGALS